MELKIYNTMSRQKEKFAPLFKNPNYTGDKNVVGIYTCGPTVYRDPHIGNLRAYHFADILRSTIQNILGYQLKHVVNLTDVGHLTDDADDGEDKMEQGAKRGKITVWQLADKYIENFQTAIEKLNIDKFDVMPRATEHIPEQIEMIEKLTEKGYTYTIPNDGIYMDTCKIKDYGELCNLDKQCLKAGARIQNENKKNPTDFSLRKFSPKDSKRQMERDSPWGKGFPGRHIECSAMSSKYLGDQFDIHTGGVDHIGVHHTNEIAQSECCFGKKPRVKYRMHNQFLNLGGKKLAKSKGGLVTLNTVVEKGYDPMDLRYFYFTAHYRSFLDFSRELLDQARKSRLNMKKKIKNSKLTLDESIYRLINDFFKDRKYDNLQEVTKQKAPSWLISRNNKDNLEQLMEDWLKLDPKIEEVDSFDDYRQVRNIDGNSIRMSKPICYPKGYRLFIEIFYNILLALFDDINTPVIIANLHRVNFNDGMKDYYYAFIKWLDDNFLKLDLFVEEEQEKKAEIPINIQKLAQKRREAKQSNDRALADKIRDELKQKGYIIKDSGDGFEVEEG